MIQANNHGHCASHTRTNIKEKFTDGFAVITAELIQSGIWSKLEDRHRKVLPCVLSHYPDMWPGLKHLSKLSGLSKSTVVRALNELDHIGLLTKSKRFTDQGDRDTNRYTLAEMKNPETVKGILKYLDHDQFLQLTNNLYAGGKHDIDKDVIELLSPQGVVSDTANHGGVRSSEQRVVSDRVVTKKQSIINKNKEHAGIDFVLYADCSTNPVDKSSTVQVTESHPNPTTDSLSTTIEEGSTVSTDKCNSVAAKDSSSNPTTEHSSTPDTNNSTVPDTSSCSKPDTRTRMMQVLKKGALASTVKDIPESLIGTSQPRASSNDTNPSREKGVGESYIDPSDGVKVYVRTEPPRQLSGDYASNLPRQIRQARNADQAALYQENNTHQAHNPQIKKIEQILEEEAGLNDQNHTLATNLVCSNGYGLEELRALIADTQKKATRCPEGLLMKRLKDGDRLTVIEGYDESIPAHRDTMERAVDWMEERGIVSGGQRKLELRTQKGPIWLS